ncbi:hypothetical protein GCM10027285_08230 [Oleiagrimonas citrea]
MPSTNAWPRMRDAHATTRRRFTARAVNTGTPFLIRASMMSPFPGATRKQCPASRCIRRTQFPFSLLPEFEQSTRSNALTARFESTETRAPDPQVENVQTQRVMS